MKHFWLFWLILPLVLLGCGGEDEDSSPVQDSQVQAPATTEPNIQVVANQSVQEPTLAATVNNENITLEELQREISLMQVDGTTPAANQDELMRSVLERLIEQKLIEQAAQRLEISISDEQIQEEIAVLQATAEEEGFSMEEFFAAQGIQPEDYPRRIRQMLLTEAVNEQVTAGVTTTAPQVHARHILVNDEATARQILDELNQGGDFVALAAQYSLDPSTREAGGDLGWVAPGDLLQSEVEAMIFALPANARAPEPVKSILGYHIIESIERAEDRPLEPAKIAQKRQEAWLNWLAEQRSSADIVRYVGTN